MTESLDKVLIITKDEEKIIKETNERTEKEINEDVEVLKEWLKKQPHLPQEVDEVRLRMMLYLNKFSVEKTKKKLDTYFSIKNIVPEFYENRGPLHPDIITQMDNTVFMPLPRLTPSCTRAYIFQFLNEDGNKFNMNSHLKILFSILDVRMTCDMCLGDEYIIDFKHAKFGHLVQFTPTVIKKAYTLLEKAYSDKIKGMHFINLPPAATPVVAIFNAVLSEKLANRVIIHKNLSSLHKALSKDILPDEYDGKAGSIADLYKNWRAYYKTKHEELETLGKIKSDENKRIGEPFNSDMFGMCGTFRKLTLD